MNTDKLAPVFLDNKPITLNDPKPKVSAILSASGKPETTDVKWLQFQPNSQGKALRGEEVLDRTTDPSKPIYLTSTAKAGGVTKGHEASIGLAPAFSESGKAGGKASVQDTKRGAQGDSEGKLNAQEDSEEKPDVQDDSEGMQSDADFKGERGREKDDAE
jgi:hypothetical protein